MFEVILKVRFSKIDKRIKGDIGFLKEFYL